MPCCFDQEGLHEMLDDKTNICFIGIWAFGQNLSGINIVADYMLKSKPDMIIDNNDLLLATEKNNLSSNRTLRLLKSQPTKKER